MESIDHREINIVLSAETGRNERFLEAADDALLDAHEGTDGVRGLLMVALASCWPDDCRPSTIDECSIRLDRLREILVQGLVMPDTAQKLRNAFDLDPDLENTIEEARMFAEVSSALRCEREWMASLKMARHDRGLSR